MSSTTVQRIAIVKWGPRDGLSEAMQRQLEGLGYAVEPFVFTQPLPKQADVIFTFAPYGRLTPIIQQLAHMPRATRPIFVHWNFEGIPDPHLPRWFVRSVVGARGWLDLGRDAGGIRNWIATRSPLKVFTTHLHKYRYIADYLLAQRLGVLGLFCETSSFYASYWRKLGLNPLVFAWGSAPEWGIADSDELPPCRDIDVLWMGKRRTLRRGRLLDRVRAELAAHGVNMYVADNVERPFIYEEERNRVLRRTKITLNLLPVLHDCNFPYRFHITALNRSMVITETMWKHADYYLDGEHYVSAAPDHLAKTILYYLQHEDERQRIAENAYHLVKDKFTLRNSLEQVMNKAISANGGRQ